MLWSMLTFFCSKRGLPAFIGQILLFHLFGRLNSLNFVSILRVELCFLTTMFCENIFKRVIREYRRVYLDEPLVFFPIFVSSDMPCALTRLGRQLPAFANIRSISMAGCKTFIWINLGFASTSFSRPGVTKSQLDSYPWGYISSNLPTFVFYSSEGLVISSISSRCWSLMWWQWYFSKWYSFTSSL